MTNHNVRVLIVESDNAVGENITEYLDNYGYSSDIVSAHTMIPDKMQNQRYDLVVLEQRCVHDEKLSVINSIRKYDSDVEVVVMLDNPSVDTMIDLSNRAITKFVVKPFTSREFNKRVIEGVKSTLMKREYEIFSKNREEIIHVLERNKIHLFSVNETANA